MDPAPSLNGSAGVTPSGLNTSWIDEVIMADFTCPGVHVGCAANTSAATPVAWGADIDVPAMAWKFSPGGPEATEPGAGSGVLPARISMPGAVMSGLTQSPSGPREENVVMTSPAAVLVGVPVAHVAVTPVWLFMNARNASVSCGTCGVLPPSSMTVGTQKLSVNRSWCVGLYRIIPAAPPCRTLKLDAARPAGLPRADTTTIPLTDPAENAFEQVESVECPLTSVALTPEVALEMGCVMDEPVKLAVSALLAVRCSVVRYRRDGYDAPTVFSHGPPWSDVAAPGPELPAEAFARPPAA